MKTRFFLVIILISCCFSHICAQTYTFDSEISEATLHPGGNTSTRDLEDVAVDDSGYIYVLDGELSSIKIFSKEGIYIYQDGELEDQ